MNPLSGLKRLLGAALVAPLSFATACGGESGEVETEAVAVEPIDETEAPIVNASGMAHLAVDDVLSDSETDDDNDDNDSTEESKYDGDDVEPIREIPPMGEYAHPDFK